MAFSISLIRSNMLNCKVCHVLVLFLIDLGFQDDLLLHSAAPSAIESTYRALLILLNADQMVSKVGDFEVVHILQLWHYLFYLFYGEQAYFEHMILYKMD